MMESEKEKVEETMRVLIDGATVWNGTGALPFPGKVLIEDERIAAIAPQSETLAADGAERIDAAGKFLMPGMVEATRTCPSSIRRAARRWASCRPRTIRCSPWTPRANC